MKKACILFPYPMGDSFLSGGVSKLVVANIEAIKDDYEVSVVAPLDNAGFKVFMKEKYPEIEVYLVDFLPLARFVDNKNPLLRTVGVVKRIFKSMATNKNVEAVIKDINPHVMHFHGEVTYPYLKYGMRIGAGTIFHTSCFRFSKPEFLRKLVVNNSLKNSSLIISPTKSISELFGTNPKNVVVPNPIITVDGRQKQTGTPMESEFLNYDGLKLLFVGRICVVKQIHYMVQAIAGLTEEEKKKVKFFVIGKPNFDPDYVYFDELKKYITEHHIEENVIFLGYKNNVDEYMQKADVGVLISESEAISMAGIEYLHNSLPIIGFDNPGINETIEDNVDGVLVPNGDVEGLKNAIRRFFDADTLATMKKSAYEQCELNFSMEAFRKRLLKYYKQIERK